MTEDILHTVDFIEREEYIEEEYPEHIYAVSASMQIPLPQRGDVVTFGWHTKNGERADNVDLHRSSRSSSDVGYEKSKEYEVLAVDQHYHHSRKTANGKFAVDRIEVGTKVIVQEYDDE